MVNNIPSTKVPTAGSTVVSHGSAKFSEDGTHIWIMFHNGSKQTLPIILKPQNIKQRKDMVGYLDFDEGKFPRNMYLAIRQRMQIDMATLLDDVAVLFMCHFHLYVSSHRRFP
ncbi:unnamed protein product [Rhizoctonia solani]|uniref:Uncharacterized protein n=1 Tax=Rhizoctonia solani TaxID=456999 RepID=A0A8H3HQH5_9AGAM|nr:unnamed protein product [Rhizoctonia solani]